MAASPEVIEKIRKLLALAGNNPNEHEAAAAAAKAQALMLEHDLASGDVEAKVDPRVSGVDRTRHTLRQHGKPGNWKIALYETVARTSDCYVWVGEYSGQMVGRRSDIEMAEYLFAYLVSQLERLQQEFGKERWAELREFARAQGITTHEAETEFKWRGKHPLRAKDSWIKGAVQSVRETLRARKAERDGQVAGAYALVVSKAAAIEDYLAQQNGYKDKADYDAQMKARREAWAAAEGTAVAKPLTPAQQRREEEKWRRQYERQARTEANRRYRESANTDWTAYERGRETGRTIGIREGIRGGSGE